MKENLLTPRILGLTHPHPHRPRFLPAGEINHLRALLQQTDKWTYE